MDKPVNIPDTPAIRLVERPKSDWSSILNGAGNGAMIGSIGLMGYEFAHHGEKHNLKDPVFLMVAGAAGLATAIGAVYGYFEAKQLNAYRNALAKDIETLHAQADRIEARQGR